MFKIIFTLELVLSYILVLSYKDKWLGTDCASHIAD